MSLKWWHSAFLSFLQNLTWYSCEGVAERLVERMLLLNGLMNTRFIDCYQYIWLHHSQEMIGYIIRYITTWEHWRLIQHAKKVYSHLLVVDALISFIQSILALQWSISRYEEQWIWWYLILNFQFKFKCLESMINLHAVKISKDILLLHHFTILHNSFKAFLGAICHQIKYWKNLKCLPEIVWFCFMIFIFCF